MKLCFTRRRRGLPIREAELLLAGDEAGASSPDTSTAYRFLVTKLWLRDLSDEAPLHEASARPADS